MVIGLEWVMGRESFLGWQQDKHADEDPVPVAGCDRIIGFTWDLRDSARSVNSIFFTTKAQKRGLESGPQA